MFKFSIAQNYIILLLFFKHIFTFIIHYVENAAEYIHTGNKRVGKGTIVVMSSVTGSTSEVVEGLKKAKEAGAVDYPDTKLAKMADYLVSYPKNEQLKFFMVADRFMYNAGEFDEYHEFYAELDEHLARALVEVEKSADELDCK